MTEVERGRRRREGGGGQVPQARGQDPGRQDLDRDEGLGLAAAEGGRMMKTSTRTTWISSKRISG